MNPALHPLRRLGHHPSPLWGGTCLKCGTTPGKPGPGWALTAAGRKAHEAWLAANTEHVPAASIEAGDLLVLGARRVRVLEVEHAAEGEDYGRASYRVGTGDETTVVYTVRITTSEGGGRTQRPMGPDSPCERWVERHEVPPAMEPGTKRAAGEGLRKALAGGGRPRVRRSPEGPRSEAHRRALSLGVRRSRWSDQQAALAREGLVHDAVPARTDVTLHRGVVIRAGECHWCQFWV